MAEDLEAMVMATRECAIQLETKFDAFIATRAEDLARLTRVEPFCEEKRRQISELQHGMATVTGHGAHDPGLISRVKSIEESIGTGSGKASIGLRVSRLEHATITKGAVIKITTFVATLWALAVSVVSASFHVNLK